MGDLPKLLTRAFAIGYLLPGTVLVLALGGVGQVFGRIEPLLAIVTQRDVLAGVVAALAILFASIVLLAINLPLIRILEGYGQLNPALPFAGIRRAQFRKLSKRAAENEPDGRAQMELAHDFPEAEGLVLPTKFGNVMRAFEVYPRVLYGIESTIGWTRLQAVIPRHYGEQVNDVKSQVDFWVNLWFTGWFTALVYLVLAALTRTLPAPWVPLLALAVALMAAKGARAMAYSWGAMVMSAFDLYRRDLAEQLGLELPRSSKKEREMWQLASQVWVYRSRLAGERLDAFRQPQGKRRTTGAPASRQHPRSGERK